MQKLAILSAFVSLAAVSAPASAATVLTFEGFSNTTYSSPITRSGFVIGNVTGDTQHFHEVDSTGFGLPNNGTGVLLNDRDSRIFINAVSNGIFSLTSIDLAAAFNNNPANSLTIEGFLNNSSTGLINIANLGQFQNVLGGALGNVDRLVFDGFGGGGGFVLDNVVLDGAIGSAVPEPAAWAFMILGFGAIGGAMRRQRKASVKVSYA